MRYEAAHNPVERSRTTQGIGQGVLFGVRCRKFSHGIIAMRLETPSFRTSWNGEVLPVGDDEFITS
jgi:hypothetical protein